MDASERLASADLTGTLTMTSGAERLDRMVARTHRRSRCGEALRLPLIDGWKPGEVWWTAPVDLAFLNADGALFGGYIAALFDDAVGHVALSVLRDDETAVTSELCVSFLRPVSPTDASLTLAAALINRSRRQLHIEARLTRGSDDQLVARANAVVARISRSPNGQAQAEARAAPEPR
jgi:uncharacterized protein (TIGR00369 family)